MIKLPEPLTEDALKAMIKDRRYWTTWHPEHREYVAAVTEGYRKLFPGPLKYDATGRMIRLEPVEQVGGPDTTVQVDAYTQSRDGNTVPVSAHTRGAPGTGGMGDKDDDKKDKTILSKESVRKSMAFIEGPIKIRSDGAGDGSFEANRSGKSGTRPHHGVDIEAEPNTLVTSPVDGEVVGITNTYLPDADLYNGDFKSIKIKDKEGFTYVMGYVKPEGASGKTLIKKGDKIKAGQSIGTVQDRARFDSKKRMKNHVHFETRDKQNKVVNPMPAINKWKNDEYRKAMERRSASEISV